MDYKKPQDTLVHGGIGLYPLTTADQVILSDGGRLEKAGKINADKLSGKTLAEIMLALYPVGAVYISVNSTSPASLFGGTWEQLKDRFLLGAGGGYAAGGTGGAATHTLTNDEIPAHDHESSILYTQSGYGNTSKPWEMYITATSGDGWSSTTGTAGTLTNVNTRRLRNVSKTGGGAAHNNMPPYLAVYMWKRVS